MSERLSGALGRAVVAYPFMVMALAVIVARQASRDTAALDFVGWLMWALLWVGIAAVATGFIVIPILAAELLLWSFVTERVPWFEGTWSGAITSCLVIATPWVLAPQARVAGALLIGAGLLMARLVVPSLRPGRAEAGA